MREAEPACDQLRNDHRAIEQHLDILLVALLHLTPERIPEIRATVCQLQDLAALHFEKEEKIFYPRLRPQAAGLLDRLDQQHEEVRELERYLAELLAEPPQTLEVRWLNAVVDYSLADQVTLLKDVRGRTVHWEWRSTPLPWEWLGAILGVLALGLGLWLLWQQRRDDVSKLGGQLQRLAVRCGLLEPGRWLEELPKGKSEVPEALGRAVARYLEARFGNRPLTPGERTALVEAARDALRPLHAG